MLAVELPVQYAYVGYPAVDNLSTNGRDNVAFDI